VSLDVHRKAEQLMDQADLLAVRGQRQEAAALYRASASLEAEALDLIPPERQRTRGIVAVSAVALFRKAGAIREALRHAYRYLGREDLPESAHYELEELLDELRGEEAASQAEQVLSRNSIEWVFTGPAIGLGSAPLNLMLQKMDQIEKYGVRVFEYLLGAPPRLTGPVDPSIREAFGMTVSQPAAGSFRFQVRFLTPTKQLSLFSSDLPPSPEQVGEVFSEILGSVQNPIASRLADAVTDSRYREIFYTLVRSIAPDGRRLSRIQASNLSDTKPSTVTLTPHTKKLITDQLGVEKSHPSTEEEVVITNTLRALHLNKEWIELGSAGEEIRCYTGKDIVLEDVVEGLVNRPVRVTCFTGKGGRLVVRDIVEYVPEDDQGKVVDIGRSGT
jgi:hypothetical protein